MDKTKIETRLADISLLENVEEKSFDTGHRSGHKRRTFGFSNLCGTVEG